MFRLRDAAIRGLGRVVSGIQNRTAGGIVAGTVIGCGILYPDAAWAQHHPAAERLEKIIPTAHGNITHQDLEGFGKYSKQGNINRDNFMKAFNDIGIKNDDVIRSFFDAFDTNGNGTISFAEFASGLAVIGLGSEDPHKKLRFVFDAMDLNGDGVVNKEDLNKIIHALLSTRENLWLQNESFDTDEQCEAASSFTGDISIIPTSLVGEKAHDPRRLVEYRKAMRLEELHEEFPFTKGLPLDDTIEALSGLMSHHIFHAADHNKDEKVTFEEFASWVDDNSEYSQFLMNLFGGLHVQVTPSHRDLVEKYNYFAPP
jgi:Ca2+-binding EF-hand superfamily protein